MSLFIGRSSNDIRSRLGLVEDAVNSTRVNGSANGTGVLMRRGSGGVGLVAQQSIPQIPNVANAFPLNPGSSVSTNSSPKFTINYGTYGGFVPTISGTAIVPATASNIITLSPTDQVVYMQCDFTYTGSSPIITDAEIMSATNSAFAALTSTAASGSGTVYQILFGVTITAPVGSGPYTVVAAPAVGGSQNFGVCIAGGGGSDSINGPWGV